MTKIDDSLSAFPIANTEYVLYGRGMTLRDWFAGQMLAGNIGNPWAANAEDVAARCYEVADAMIAARMENLDG